MYLHHQFTHSSNATQENDSYQMKQNKTAEILPTFKLQPERHQPTVTIDLETNHVNCWTC